MDRLFRLVSKTRLKSFQMSRRGAKSAILTRLTEDKKDAVRVKAPISDEEDRNSSYKPAGTVDDVFEEGIDEEQLASNAASKVLLEELRVYNRHIEQTPSWLKDLQSKVCDNRTPAQVSRLIKPWMVKTDIDYITYYRSRHLGWQIPSPPAGTIVKKDPQRFVYGPEEAAAYTAVHLPPRLAITKRLLSEHRNRHPHFEPRRILDFGCGPGTASLAVMETWPELKSEMDITALDPSRAMLDAAQIILLRGRSGSKTSSNLINKNKNKGNIPSFSFVSRSLDVVQKVLRSHPHTAQYKAHNTIKNDNVSSEITQNYNGRYDLILCGFVLGELQSDEQRQAAVQLLYELLDVNGILLILEPGHVMGSHIVRTSRQQLLTMSQTMDKKGHFQNFLDIPQYKLKVQQKQSRSAIDPNDSTSYGQMLLPPVHAGSNHSDAISTVVAPCTHDQHCPLGISQRCAFTQRVAGSGLGAVIHKDSEAKFSYVVVAKQLRSGNGSSASPSNGDSNRKKPVNHIDRYIRNMSETTVETTEEVSKELDEEAKLLLEKTPPQLLEAALDPSNRTAIGKLLRSHAADSALWESYFNNQPVWIREEWARIIKPPLKKDGHIILDICTFDGTLQRVTQARTALNRALPGLFTMLRKSSPGGLLPTPLVTRGNAMVINSYQLGLADAQHDSWDNDDDVDSATAGKMKKGGKRGRGSRLHQEDDHQHQVVLPSGRGFLSEEDDNDLDVDSHQENTTKKVKSRTQGGRQRGRRR